MKHTPFLLIDLAATTLTEEEAELLQHPYVAGVVLFKRNYVNPQQLRTLCQAIRNVRAAPLLITVDQEGGRVQRFQQEFVRLPPLHALGDLYDRNPELALQMTSTAAKIMASELLAVGVDLSFAPVLDLYREDSAIIADRALHADATVIATLATVYINSLQQAGMAACAKHFPGHGSIVEDTHVTIARDPRSLSDIAARDLIPFQHTIVHGLPALMTAHVIYPHVDSHYPASCSRIWLHDILRKQYGFQGIIISDDLQMQAVHYLGDCIARVQCAMQAGSQLIILCNNKQGVIEVLDRYTPTNQQSFVLDVLLAQRQYSWETLHADSQWQQLCDRFQHCFQPQAEAIR